MPSSFKLHKVNWLIAEWDFILLLSLTVQCPHSMILINRFSVLADKFSKQSGGILRSGRTDFGRGGRLI